ncbi:hypothetical protein EG329_005195 [Mollisiaceae sp. DMI_Dod_QoI]|nr:hypothetical protein EG329_005195 [Helotiales sp. DMI_Dod_QoI]
MPPKKINTDPNQNAAKNPPVMKLRKDRYLEERGSDGLTAPDIDDPQPYSPDWPPGSEDRPPYPLMAPPARLTGATAMSRTCEVCGQHFPREGMYYEHMKSFHPWAPRSYRHGVYRPPASFEPNSETRRGRVQGNELANQLDMRVVKSNRLATDLGFNTDNPDGSARVQNLTEDEKRGYLYLYDVANQANLAPETTGIYEAPEKPEPSKFRIGRIIAPTSKDGEAIGTNKRDIASRRALTAEFMPFPNILNFDNDMAIGDLVLYLDSLDEPYPFFRSIEERQGKPGEYLHIPWRMIQPIDSPFGLPEDVKFDKDGVGLPMAECLNEDYDKVAVGNGLGIAMSSSPDNWLAANSELLLRLHPFNAQENRGSRLTLFRGEDTIVTLMDSERRRGEIINRELLHPFIYPWNLKFEREWLANHIRSLKENSYNDGRTNTPSMPTKFRLGRIIAPITKTGEAIDSTESSIMDEESLVYVPNRAEAGSSERFSVGDIVFFMTDDINNPKPMFRDVFGNDIHIPSRMIQRLHLPFGIPEDIEFALDGVGFPLMVPANPFTVKDGLDVDKTERDWDVCQYELLLRTTPSGIKYGRAWDVKDKLVVVDYERRRGVAPSTQNALKWLTRFSWGVKVDPKWLAKFLKAWSEEQTPEPVIDHEALKKQEKEAAARAAKEQQKAQDAADALKRQQEAHVPILTLAQFQAFYNELQTLQGGEDFVTTTITTLRQYVEAHIIQLSNQGLDAETAALANLRPRFWGPLYQLLQQSPTFTNFVAVAVITRLIAIVDVLRGSAKNSTQSLRRENGPSPRQEVPGSLLSFFNSLQSDDGNSNAPQPAQTGEIIKDKPQSHSGSKSGEKRNFAQTQQDTGYDQAISNNDANASQATQTTQQAELVPGNRRIHIGFFKRIQRYLTAMVDGGDEELAAQITNTRTWCEDMIKTLNAESLFTEDAAMAAQRPASWTAVRAFIQAPERTVNATPQVVGTYARLNKIVDVLAGETPWFVYSKEANAERGDSWDGRNDGNDGDGGDDEDDEDDERPKKPRYTTS